MTLLAASVDAIGDGLSVPDEPQENAPSFVSRTCQDTQSDASQRATERHLREDCLPLEPRLRRWIANRGVPSHDIDDIVQDVYLRILKACPGSEVRSWFAYLSRAAFSEIAQRRRRAALVPIEPVDCSILGLFADPSPCAAQIAESRQRLQKVQDAIDAMSAVHRSALVLRRFEELPCRDTALTLGVCQRTVESHLSHALHALEEADPDPFRRAKTRRAITRKKPSISGRKSEMPRDNPQ